MDVSSSHCGLRIDRANAYDTGEWKCHVTETPSGSTLYSAVDLYVSNHTTLHISDPDLEEDSSQARTGSCMCHRVALPVGGPELHFVDVFLPLKALNFINDPILFISMQGVHLLRQFAHIRTAHCAAQGDATHGHGKLFLTSNYEVPPTNRAAWQLYSSYPPASVSLH